MQKTKEFTPRVFPILDTGQDHAIPAAALADRLNIDKRHLRAMVHAERKHGYLILSDDTGYYRAANREEVQRFYHSMHCRLVSAAENQVEARRLLDQTEGQTTLYVSDEEGR